jgi:hypothetical protein
MDNAHAIAFLCQLILERFSIIPNGNTGLPGSKNSPMPMGSALGTLNNVDDRAVASRFRRLVRCQ